MKELQAIIEAFEQNHFDGKTSVLATVIEVQGSTYRRPGARMLMTQGGLRVGSISGGCLEADVCEWAQQVIVSGQPVVVTYDTTSDADIVWGLGLGCNGVVRVLLKSLDLNGQLNPVAFLRECLRHKQRGVLATVFRKEGQVNVKVGACLMLCADGTMTCDIEEPALTLGVLTDAQAALQDERSSVKSYPLLAGSAEVFIEVIQPPTPLMIFGAGHDALPVAHFAKALGWHVTVIDSRATETTLERFAMADSVILTRPETARNQVKVDQHTVAVVMTHNYLHDLEFLKMLLPSVVRYLGILGPKRRAQRLLQDLRTEGMVYTKTQLQRFYGPVGIDIGADTPEEIALAIIAEIQAVLANRSGGFLRNRQEAIHQQLDEKESQPSAEFG